MVIGQEEWFNHERSNEESMDEPQAESTDEEAHREVLLPKGRRNDQRSIRHIEGFIAPCYQHKRQKAEFHLSNILGHRKGSMAMLQESKSCKNRDALRAIFKSQMH